MISIRKAINESDKSLCFKLRAEVFCKEQNVPGETERDEYDDTCIHWLAFASNGTSKEVPAGVARVVIKATTELSSDNSKEFIGKIGRVAVLPEHRGQGIAKLIMNALEEDLIENDPHVTKTFLHAQQDKKGFYQKIGYYVLDPESSPFLEENILHVKMAKNIK
ncbi:hypothetical protein DSO57_1005693 [Entomophthora muscae]|nr:hypothetical protein DSO57_1005693 [Entomophthora muscae]